MSNKQSITKQSITLNANDDCFARAEKLFKSIGLIDIEGLSYRLAKGIKLYMDLDNKAHELTLSRKETIKP